ncbi:hypothetical protein Ahy_B02g060333 isoform B [Arachis hypogaea]|uniref:Uncharacterized protein n=1 Tax=Arachis hypogaea TaxID=3818 RepID=A0A445AIB1_ARAHY|nr:hypothetical protein Ahy_B02g060333 isoform B [Arachis hypogaea]
MEGRLKFDDGKKEMKVDVDPFEADAIFVEPCFGVNMVRSVYPRAGDGLLDFLFQQKIKDRDVSLCPRLWCPVDLELSGVPETGCSILIQSTVGTSGTSSNQYPYYRGRARGYPRGRGGRKNFNQNKKSQVEVSKGATPSVHSRIVFPSDGETCPKGIPSPAKMEKGKSIAQSSGVDKVKEVDVDKEYFEEGDDDMIGTILIIPTEYLGEYEGEPEEDYDLEDEEAFPLSESKMSLGIFFGLLKNKCLISACSI